MLSVIVWTGRIFLILLVLRLLLRLFTPKSRRGGRAPGGPQPGGPFGGRQSPPERIGGQLVRCLQCGTYVPQANAINALRGGEIQHFCSGKCRDDFAAAQL